MEVEFSHTLGTSDVRLCRIPSSPLYTPLILGLRTFRHGRFCRSRISDSMELQPGSFFGSVRIQVPGLPIHALLLSSTLILIIPSILLGCRCFPQYRTTIIVNPPLLGAILTQNYSNSIMRVELQGFPLTACLTICCLRDLY